MNYQETTKEHFSALKALADINLQISEAKNALIRLQEQETEYLVSREKKAVERIQNVLIQSHNLIEETNKNYEIIEDFAKSVSEGAKFLQTASEGFQELIKTKEQHYTLWERDIKNQEETIISLRNNLKVDSVNIANQRKELDERNVRLNTLETKLASDRGEVDRKIMRLKENRI